MANKKILEFCLAHGLGGLEMFVANCYEDFSHKTSCEVIVQKDSKLDKYLENGKKFYMKRSKFFPLLPALKLARYIDAHAIDIIHFHWNKDSITVVLAKVLSKRKPKIVQSRHMGMTRFKNDIFHRFIYKNIDMIHAVTDEVKKQLERFIPQEVRPKVQRIYLGVEENKIDKERVEILRKEYGLAESFVVGIVGRIEKGKGQYKVLEAVSMLKEMDVKVVVVGSFMSEGYERELRKLTQDLGIASKVIFTGFTKEVHEHIKLFDVNVLATENETFGLVVIEAMINQVPMIATNRGGPLEIIDDGVDGLLFDGTSEDLAQKIELYYKDKTLVEKIQKNALKKVQEKFNKTKQLGKLYESITKI